MCIWEYSVFKKWYNNFKHPCTIQLTHLFNMYCAASLGHSSEYKEKVISSQKSKRGDGLLQFARFYD